MTMLTDPLGWFTLRVPAGWAAEHHDGVTLLRRPHGEAFVCVGGGRNRQGAIPGFGGPGFLRRFLRTIGFDVAEDAIRTTLAAGHEIHSWQRADATSVGHYFSVTDGETALLISYSGTPAEALVDTADVDAAVLSVRLFHSPPPRIH